jgi:hypothetical protein
LFLENPLLASQLGRGDGGSLSNGPGSNAKLFFSVGLPAGSPYNNSAPLRLFSLDSTDDSGVGYWLALWGAIPAREIGITIYSRDLIQIAVCLLMA